MIQLRQGDILLKQIDKLPNNLQPVEATKRGFVLAEGEATGHAHIVQKSANTAMFFDKSNNKLYLVLTSQETLKHEEHDHINLPIGNYEVIRQREYRPEGIIRVAD
jgi:hypothetical protein